MSRKQFTRTTGPLVGLLLTAAVAVVLPSTTASATGSSDSARSAPSRLAATAYAMKGSGFGTRVRGGDVPADSRTTAFQALGCSNRAGQTKQVEEVEQNVPGLGSVAAVRTTVRTTRRDGTVASTTTQRIASIVLAESGLGSLSIEGVRSQARAFHDGSGFRATASSDIGRLVFRPVIGDPQVLALPAPGRTLRIPGLAEIQLGTQQTRTSRDGSSAAATGLLVRVIPTGTMVTIGRAQAGISDGVESVLFRGQSSGLRASGLGGTLEKGRTPLSLMPCQGTGNQLREKGLASVDLADQIEVGAVTSAQRAWQRGSRAAAYERGGLARIALGDGRLVITGVVGKANLHRDGRRSTYDVRGTTVGSVVLDGERQTFPDTGVLEIPGIARLEPRVVTRKPRGIAVVALRITLLDGTLATIDLGNAAVGASPSGR